MLVILWILGGLIALGLIAMLLLPMLIDEQALIDLAQEQVRTCLLYTSPSPRD